MELIRRIRKEFRRYYIKEGPRRVRELPRREWAYIPFPPQGEASMIRHLGFEDYKTMRIYFIQNLPRHLYYSTAYYRDPKAPEMEEKGWIGADLVFDIDADHLPGIEGRNYEEVLEMAKKEMIRLIEDFLMGDLGFSERAMEISFSGGRGYHVKVFSREVIGIDGNARKEIGDYIRGVGGDPEEIHKLISFGANFGWPGRIAKEARRLKMLSEREITNFFLSRGIEVGKEVIRGIKLGSVFKRRSNLGKKVVEALISALRVEIDPQVTGDMKRLIRAPGSLHGKTGLRVTPLTLEGLKEFSPLEEAVVLGEEEVKVKYLEELEDWKVSLARGVKIKDFQIDPIPGEVISAPIYAAAPMLFMFKLIEEVGNGRRQDSQRGLPGLEQSSL